MFTVLLWACGILFALIVIGSLPGLRDVLRPLMGMIATGIVELAKFFGGYILWMAKLVLYSHRDLLKHLAHRRRYFDPAEDAREDR